jgi:hypothetical protein
MPRCSDSCGLFTRPEDVAKTRHEDGQTYHCCRWCKLPNGDYVNTAEEGIQRRRAERQDSEA